MERAIEKLKETPHWSYSAFSTYLQCPMKFCFRYMEHAKAERTSVCLPFGRAFHSVLSERAVRGSSYTLDDALQDFSLFFRNECEASENLTLKPEESLEGCKEKGLAMINLALENWQDDFTVKSTAEAFCIQIPGLSKPLIGEFDLVVTDGGDVAVCDWKTSSARWPAGKADRDLQATAFCYAYRKLHGVNPVFRFDVYTKTKIPTLNSCYTVRTQDELNRFEFIAGKIEESVQAGCFYPNDSALGCGDCPYRDRCRKLTRKEA